MDYYCQNCYRINEQSHCRHCGKDGLLEARDEDYCFFVEINSMRGEMFKGALADSGIPFSDYPSGNGVRTQFALKLENVKVFVPYEFIEGAREIYHELFSSFEQEQRRQLLDNLDDFFISKRNQKKFLKLIKNQTEPIDFCRQIIENSEKIENKGLITGCTKGGNYLFVYRDNDYIIINSATNEILSLRLAK